MSFILLWVRIVEVLLIVVPKKWKFDVKAICFYFECQNLITEWHREELGKRDPKFAMVQDNLRLIAERNRLRGEGMSAGDPKFPDLIDQRGSEYPGIPEPFDKYPRDFVKHD